MLEEAIGEAPQLSAEERAEKNPFLVALGERVRGLRSRRGLTRKSLAGAADVSERHLANLEYGLGRHELLDKDTKRGMCAHASAGVHGESPNSVPLVCKEPKDSD